MDGVEMLEEARAAGLAVWSEGDKLVIKGPRSAGALALSLIEHKAQVLPLVRQPVIPWVLAEWRRTSIPQWRSILQVSIAQGDRQREEYARWMLRDVLLDTNYCER